MTRASANLAPMPHRLVDLAGSGSSFVEVWDGVLHEFRNHLKVLTAAGLELRAEMPPAVALHVSESVHEMERNVQSLGSLLSLADASLRTGEPVVSALGQVFERAIRLASPAVGRSVSITAAKDQALGVKNRGKALECLLASLIIELARATPPTTREGELSRAPRIQILAEVTRGSLSIAVESSGPLPPAGSWRLLLASELAGRLDATVSPSGDGAAFVVLFR